jgi:hypothetical protein
MIPFIEARKLVVAAQARDVALIASYLFHCDDKADVARSLAALRRNLPDQFKKPSAALSPRHCGSRGRSRSTCVC